MITGCSEFALLASGTSLAASQNVYSKVYSGSNVLTIFSTDKDIKTHIYEKFDTHFGHSYRHGIKNSSP